MKIFKRCPVCQGRTSNLEYMYQRKQRRFSKTIKAKYCIDCNIIIPLEDLKYWNGNECIVTSQSLESWIKN